jgi:hypothetical protein
MFSRIPTPWRQRGLACASLLLGFAMGTLHFAALAASEGGEGNTPIKDSGWPKGAAAIFNQTERIAYWRGARDGQWTAEFRGDTKAFNAALADFAKLENTTRRLVIHDGVGSSIWLRDKQGKGDDAAKAADAKMDWSFMVWQTAAWDRRPELFMTGVRPHNADDRLPSEINVYVGGNVKWPDVHVPDGLAIDDQRMSIHGFSQEDGHVFEGNVVDLATKKPLRARVRLQVIEYVKGNEYTYRYIAGTVADEKGHWVLTNIPGEKRYQPIVEMDGYIMRIVACVDLEKEPRWRNFDTAISRPGPISGRVVDDAGAPLADAHVHIYPIVAGDTGRYDCAADRTTSGADGRFLLERIPQGSTTIFVTKPGYVRPGLGEQITTPKSDITLTMMKGASVVISVDYTAWPKKPDGYYVRIEPEGGPATGKWSASGSADAKNQVVYDNMPPGKYQVWGRPNPGGEKDNSDPVVFELKSGEKTEVKLPAKFVPPPLPDPQFKPQPPPKTNDTF